MHTGLKNEADHPAALVFCVSRAGMEICRGELEACRAQMAAEGIDVQVRVYDDDEAPERPEPSVLYLADSGALCRRIRQAGGMACGYLHAGNRQDRFEGTLYLLSEPDQVEPDSFLKIYQRLRGYPWTIAVTKRCVIREMRTDDLDALYRLYDDDAARRFLAPLSGNREEEKQMLAAYIEKVYGMYGYGYWMVTDRVTGRVLGRVGFGLPGKDSAGPDFGYLIAGDCRRQGYALEAARAVLAYAKENLDFFEIEAHTDPENIASTALLQRLGFTLKAHEGGQMVYSLVL